MSARGPLPEQRPPLAIGQLGHLRQQGRIVVNGIELKWSSGMSSALDHAQTVAGLYDGAFKLRGPMSTGLGLDIGPVAVFRTDGLDIVLASRRAQNFDCEYFRAFGIEPTEKSVLAVKSAQHFRADYAPIASGIAVVDEGGGITSHDLRALSFRNIRRPIWPLDDIPS